MSKTLTPYKQPPMFHPSYFETTISDTPGGTRIIKEIQKERLKKVDTDDLNHLNSPGNFKFTQDDKDISNHNAKYMTKTVFEDSLLNFLYFSKKNIQNIQNIVKLKIYKETNQVVDHQSFNELMVVMRSIYFEYSSHPPILKEDMPDDIKKKVLQMYTDEVSRLNNIVVDYVYPNVLSQLQAYIMYLRDASNLPYQQSQPTASDDVTGQREYRSITQVLLGTKL